MPHCSISEMLRAMEMRMKNSGPEVAMLHIIVNLGHGIRWRMMDSSIKRMARRAMG